MSPRAVWVAHRAGPTRGGCELGEGSHCHDRRRRRLVREECGLATGPCLLDDLAAEIDAFVADEDAGTSDELVHLVFCLAAERASQRAVRPLRDSTALEHHGASTPPASTLREGKSSQQQPGYLSQGWMMTPRSTRHPQLAQVISISSGSIRGGTAPVAGTASQPERHGSDARFHACDGQAPGRTGSTLRPRDALQVGADFLVPSGRHSTNSPALRAARRSFHLPLSLP